MTRLYRASSFLVPLYRREEISAFHNYVIATIPQPLSSAVYLRMKLSKETIVLTGGSDDTEQVRRMTLKWILRQKKFLRTWDGSNCFRIREVTDFEIGGRRVESYGSGQGEVVSPCKKKS